MARQADPLVDVHPPFQRYRRAEEALWEHYGLEPTEQFIDLHSPRVRLRVVEVGSGDPIVFVGGTGGTGPYWAPLVRELAGFRCIMVDRPGWGLSSSIDYSISEYKTVVADMLRGTLDALGLEQSHVAGASIGDNWALGLRRGTHRGSTEWSYSVADRWRLTATHPPSSGCWPHRSAPSLFVFRRHRNERTRSCVDWDTAQASMPDGWMHSSPGGLRSNGTPTRCDTSATWSVRSSVATVSDRD